MSHLSKECLSNLESKELTMLCLNRGLNARRGKANREERIDSLMKCNTEHELTIEMKAQKKILKNFTVEAISLFLILFEPFVVPYITLHFTPININK